MVRYTALDMLCCVKHDIVGRQFFFSCSRSYIRVNNGTFAARWWNDNSMSQSIHVSQVNVVNSPLLCAPASGSAPRISVLPCTESSFRDPEYQVWLKELCFLLRQKVRIICKKRKINQILKSFRWHVNLCDYFTKWPEYLVFVLIHLITYGDSGFKGFLRQCDEVPSFGRYFIHWISLKEKASGVF